MADEPLTRVTTVERAEDDYFASNPAPKNLNHTTDIVTKFVQKHSSQHRRVVLITSGGTTVPLENQTVRFIDNFSAGTRGATSAEYFLENGYAVIFLHRRFSLLPYSRHYSHSTNCFLDFMEQDDQGQVIVKDDYQREMQTVLKKYQQAQRDETLLLVPYITITEYLWTLRETAIAMQPLKGNAMFYLAAAVSDFFIPKDRLVEHKIQSGDINGKVSTTGNKLVVDLDPVPKFLKRLVDGWAPNAMIVSFKLETDPSLLISKAKQALDRYSHHLVIGNLLNTRAWEVVLISSGKEEWVRLPGHGENNEETQTNSDEIESLIVPEVVLLHDKIIHETTMRIDRFLYELPDMSIDMVSFAAPWMINMTCSGSSEDSLKVFLKDKFDEDKTNIETEQPTDTSSLDSTGLRGLSIKDRVWNTFAISSQPNTASNEGVSRSKDSQDDDTEMATRLPPVALTPEQIKERLQHEQYLKATNNDNRSTREEEARTAPLFSGDVMTRVPQLFSQYGLLGQVIQRRLSSIAQPAYTQHTSPPEDPRILLNVGAPWSAFICGVQGSGKSHSLSCILENCLLNSPVGQLPKPLSGMIFHWDRFSGYSSQQVCEAATLCSAGVPVRVLVSPSNYQTMKEAYENLPGLQNAFNKPKVMPLLFSDKQLNVKRMMTLMGVRTEDDHPPLYMEVILRILREMAQETHSTGGGLNYADFRYRLAMEEFTGAQNGPLKLRLDLLESFLRSTSESKARSVPPAQATYQQPSFRPTGNRPPRNPAAVIRPLKKLTFIEETEHKDVWTFRPGTLTIVDLSCPFVDENAACALFAICLELFLEDRSSSGRVLALDEAHKFLTGSSGAVAFTEELLQVIRQQRHLGTRVVIATQEPTISPRLLDLCNFTIVHRFQSPQWFQILTAHLAGASSTSSGAHAEQDRAALLKEILNLQLGQALLFAPSAITGFTLSPNGQEIEPMKLGIQSLLIAIRQRLTVDGGRSIMAE